MVLPSGIRVVRIVTRLNIGGPSIQAVELSSQLSPSGFDTVLVHGTLGEGEGDMTYLLDCFTPRPRVVQIPALQRAIAPVIDGAAVRHVYRLLCDVKPAIVHTHMAKAGAVGRLAALAYNRTLGRQRRAKVVHTYHGHVLEQYFGRVKTRALIAAERWLAPATDRLIAISPRVRHELLDQYRIGRAEQYRVIRLGFDLAPFLAIDERFHAHARAALGIAPGTAVVSTAGRLTAVKHQRLFLQAAELLMRTEAPVVCLIAGDGELRGELEATARALGLGEHVRFLGWRRDLDIVYAATDVFLLTSRNEGTPVALIESMAAGCAGVSTDVGGVRDVIADPSLGRVVANADPQTIAAVVGELLHDPQERRAIGQRGRQHVVTHFALSRLVSDVAALYRELLDGAPASPMTNG